MDLDVLGIGPHPDDVEMTCAGLLVKMKRRGYRTGIVHLTRGEMGSRGTPEERTREAARAAEILELDHMEFLGLADGRIGLDSDSKKRLVEALRRVRPKIVLAPFPRDPHPDHASAGRVTAEAAHFAELKKSDVAGEPHFVGQVVYAMYRANFEPSFIVDIAQEFETKKRAVLAYHSQVGEALPGEQETRLSSPQFMRGWEARAQHFGWIIGRPYGEPYFSEYAVPLADPVAAFEVPQQRRIVMRPLGG
jgi:bacillithiol biosynthesis deacetylase BshB1